MRCPAPRVDRQSAMHASSPVPADWWRTFYDDRFTAARLPADSAVEAVADFLVDTLGVKRGDSVFDQCCGTGRIGHALARRGAHVVGVDVNPRYIAQACAAAVAAQHQWFTADAFTFVTPLPCAAAFNWFTSFGFSADDHDNLAMLRCAQASLAPQGMFALETFHTPYVLAHLRPSFAEQFAADGRVIEIERTSEVDHERGLITQAWRYVVDGVEAPVQRSQLRLYTPRDFTTLLLAAGLEVVAWCGGVDGRALSDACGRAIVVARKVSA